MTNVAASSGSRLAALRGDGRRVVSATAITPSREALGADRKLSIARRRAAGKVVVIGCFAQDVQFRAKWRGEPQSGADTYS